MKLKIYLIAACTLASLLGLHPKQMFAAESPSPAPDASIERLKQVLVSYTWSWVDPRPKLWTEVHFNQDGTLTAWVGSRLVDTRHWETTGPHTAQMTGPGHDLKMREFTFDETLTKYVCQVPDVKGSGNTFQITGNRLAPVAKSAPTAAAPTPAPAPTPAAPGPGSAINALIDRKNVFANDIFGPLDHDIPPSVRDLLADLRENLLDENAHHPVVDVRAYPMAAEYCNSLIAAYDERMKGAVRLRNDAPSNAAGGPSVQKIHPNWIDYLRERDEAAATTHNNTLQTAFARQNILQWSLRAAELRKNLDASYSQFRAVARQPVGTK